MIRKDDGNRVALFDEFVENIEGVRAEIKHEVLKGVVMTCGYITALAAGAGVIVKMLVG